MSARFFLDTNVLVYATDAIDPRKHTIGSELLIKANQTGLGVISYQVAQEWFNVALRKSGLQRPAVETAYFSLIEPLWHVNSSQALTRAAWDLYQTHSISWWDSLIVCAAIQADCALLYSEDLQHGQTFSGVRVENPFLG